MIDAARVLDSQPRPAGPGLAIVGNSGGPEILAADAAAEAGLLVDGFDDATAAELRRLGAPAQNPIDLGATVTPERVGRVLDTVLASPSVDMLLTVFTTVATSDPVAVRSAVIEAAAGADKPVVAVEVGAVASPRAACRGRTVPLFGFPEPAAAALGLYRHARWVASGSEPVARPAAVDAATVRTLIATARSSGADWLRPDEVDRLLGAYGIPTCPGKVVVGADAACQAADELGYPVVLKLAEGGTHKSDVGGVRLELRDADEVRQAADDLALIRGRPVTPLLVQQMISGGTELIVGGLHEPQFGPLLMVGAGGVLADVVDDTSFRIAPVSRDEAGAMLEELRSSRLLDGFRGRSPVSRPAVADLIVRVGALLADVPEVAELDLNPVVARGELVVTLDARIRVAPPPHHPDPVVRQLRGPLHPVPVRDGTW